MKLFNFLKGRNKKDTPSVKEEKLVYGGLIRYFKLEPFWESLLEKERQVIRTIYKAERPIDHPDTYYTMEVTVIEFLHQTSIQCTLLDEQVLAEKILLEMEQLSENVIDLHNAYSRLIYTYHHNNAEHLSKEARRRKLLKYCWKDVDLFPKYKEAYFDSVQTKGLQRHINSFKILTDLLLEDHRFEDAKRICKMGIKHKLQYKKRTSYVKKLNQIKQMEKEIIDQKQAPRKELILDEVSETEKIRRANVVVRSFQSFDILALESDASLAAAMTTLNPHMNFIGEVFFMWLEENQPSKAFTEIMGTLADAKEKRENYFQKNYHYFFESPDQKPFMKHFFQNIEEQISFGRFFNTVANQGKLFNQTDVVLRLKKRYPRFKKVTKLGRGYINWLVTYASEESFSFYQQRMIASQEEFAAFFEILLFESVRKEEFFSKAITDEVEQQQFALLVQNNKEIQTMNSTNNQAKKKPNDNKRQNMFSLQRSMLKSIPDMSILAVNFFKFLDSHPESKTTKKVFQMIKNQRDKFIKDYKTVLLDPQIRVTQFTLHFFTDETEANQFKHSDLEPKNTQEMIQPYFINANLSKRGAQYLHWLDANQGSETYAYFVNLMRKKPSYFTVKQRDLFLGKAERQAFREHLFTNEEDFLAFKKEHQF